jgi:hypothetical protein
MRKDIIVINSYETMGVNLNQAEFTAPLNLSYMSDETKCYVKVISFNISDIIDVDPQLEDDWAHQQIYNLVCSLGQQTQNRSSIGVNFLASQFYRISYGLTSEISNPNIRLNAPPNGLFEFKIVNYLNKNVRLYDGQTNNYLDNIGNIQVVLEFMYE